MPIKTYCSSFSSSSDMEIFRRVEGLQPEGEEKSSSRISFNEKRPDVIILPDRMQEAAGEAAAEMPEEAAGEAAAEMPEEAAGEAAAEAAKEAAGTADPARKGQTEAPRESESAE